MTALDPLALPLRGTALIEASAGTGKTHTITTLLLRLLLERELEIGQILIVTYTRAATFELRERVRQRLLSGLQLLDRPERDGDAELQRLFAARRQHAGRDRSALARALRDFDQAAIFTIHGFCQRALGEHAFESGAPFSIQLTEDEQPLLQEIALDHYARAAYLADPDLVGSLHAHKVAPSSLALLARATAPDPSLAVLPAVVPEPPAFAAEAYARARARAAEAWRSERGALLAALTSGVLHATHYDRDEVRRVWANELDVLETFAPWQLPACIGKLRREALQRWLRKDQRFELDRPFYAAAAELWAAREALLSLADQHALYVKRTLVDYARGELARRRNLLGTRGFDDLLHRLDVALAGPGGDALQALLLARYPAALIDEFQDTDPVQYRIFRRCYRTPESSLFLIGDPKQAIYGFRGADVYAYLQAAEDARERSHSLDVNRRSDPDLLFALNALWTRGPQPFLLPEIRFTAVRPLQEARNHVAGDGAALNLLLVPGEAGKTLKKGWAEARIPEMIAAEITQLLAEGATLDGRRVQPRDVAVLCRTNVQARSTQAALAALGVPTVLDGDSSVLDSETADELSQVLWAVAAPTDGRKLGAALISALLGVDALALERLRSTGSGEQDWLERFAAWNQLWHARGFMPMFHALLDEADVRARLLAREGGERRLTDLLHLGELLHAAATREHLGPLALLQWLAEMRSDRGKRADLAGESAQVRLEHDEHALRVATIHRSKGLEYPIVFAPFLWTSWNVNDPHPRFHDEAAGRARKLDLGSSELKLHQEQAKREELAEALRISYVAMTRAKHRLYLVWGRFNYGGSSPLGYLLHHDPARLQPAEIDQQLKQLDDAGLRAALSPLVSRAEGTLELRAIRSPRDAVPYRAVAHAAPLLEARGATRTLRDQPRASSFSRLTAEPTNNADGEAGPDVDADAAAFEEPTAVPAEPTLALHSFPAGPGPGTAIHAIYEHIDFRRVDPQQLPAQVGAALAAFGLDAELQPAVVEGIAQSLLTPLDRDDPTRMLAQLAPGDRLNELEFTLCTPGSERALSAERLAAVFAAAPIAARIADYPERVRALPNVAPAEFLKGFIDLVFRHDGRFYIADYKSNLLGSDAGAYGQSALCESMAEHHYVLQYHLYLLALDRYLRMRIPDYDYERHIGGAYYLFLRGMSPQHPQGTGIFFDRPDHATLERLAEALGISP